MSSSQVLFLLLLLGGTLLFSCCKEKKTTSQTGTPESTEIEFGQKHFDFGKLAEGEIVTHTFYFKNKIPSYCSRQNTSSLRSSGTCQDPSFKLTC